MKLLVDAGNSRLKAALWRDDALEPLPPVGWREPGPVEAVRELLTALSTPPARVLAASVAAPALADALSAEVAARWDLAVEFVRVEQDFAGLHTRYERPSQLGIDRWLAALAGFHRAGGAVGVLDAGTALTLDVVTHDGQHLGGLIAPGISLMARSLTQGTAQLRLDRLEVVEGLATHTTAAISLGCREAMSGLLARAVARVTTELGAQPAWLVTGGEAPLLLECSPVRLEHVPQLVLEGLKIVGEHRP